MSLMILISVFLFWAFIRNYASQQPIRPPHSHPFLGQHTHDVVAYRVRPEAGTAAADHYEKLAKLAPQLILWIDIRPRLDGTLVVAEETTEAENPGAPLAADVIGRLPQNRMIVNFRGNRPGLVEAAAKLIDEAKASDRILIQSPEDGFLKDLREKKPLWLYGTSLAQVTQATMLASIGLEGLAPFRGDVVVMEASEREHLMDRLSDSLIQEIHRRKLKIFVVLNESDDNAEGASKAWRRDIDGLLTRHPERILAHP